MAGTVVADTLQAASTSTLVLKNGVANTPPTIQDSAGTQIGTFCRAWVNFNGTTGARNASFNVSSVTVNSGGNYSVNFTNAMPDTSYASIVTNQQQAVSNRLANNVVNTSTLVATVIHIEDGVVSFPATNTAFYLAFFR